MAYTDDMNLLMVYYNKTSLTMYFAPKRFLLHFKPKAAHSTTVNSLTSHVLTSTVSGGTTPRRLGSSPGSALPIPAYCFASVIVWTENKSDLFISFILTVKRRWRPVLWGRQLKKVINFFWGKVHPGDLAGGFSDLEMTWLHLYCAGATTEHNAS